MKPMFPKQQDTAGAVAKLVVTVLVLGVFVVAGLIYGLWTLAKNASPNSVILWAVIVTLLILPAFFLGFYFGKVEARGLLHGFDRSLDRMAGVIGEVANARDQSRITVHNAAKIPPQPQWNVNLPGIQQPVITRRSLSSGDDAIVDL